MTIECSVVNFNDWIDSMNAAGVAAGAAGKSFRSFFIALKKNKENMESDYRKHVGHLPGSTRTSRLRNKIDKMVYEWYFNFKEKDNQAN